ncbi:MAG: peptidoglycan-binding protein [Clostridia bacterium]|nr:peptidoglycan-binding protein [Clostridia bacterium]
MKKKGGVSPLGIVLIIALLGAICLVGAAALANRQEYLREAAITPTPSITPRTVRITEDPALPTSTPTPRLFQMNAVGVEVRQMQQRLMELGYYSGQADGQYGAGTKAAVEAFQRQHGLDADGIAGESTLTLLYSAGALAFRPTPTPSPTPETSTLSSGSQGEQVKKLQQRLQELGFYSGKIDGDYGKGTRSAVTLFQQQHGLSADGIAGEKTLNALYSDSAKPMAVTPTPEAIPVLSGGLPLLVNKEHPIAEDFVPSDLVNMSEYCDPDLVKIKYKDTQGVYEAVDALIEMLEAAKTDGIVNWQVSAAYRSVKDQQAIFDASVKSYMNNNGMSRTNAISATRKTVADPGTSEHHTGLAFDMTVPNTESFISTKQCKWLHEHCWDYGFIVRYQKDKEDITGFLAEAWHIRYVGTAHSTVMRDKNLCLEEYLQLAR